jgi:hypothetical protein
VVREKWSQQMPLMIQTPGASLPSRGALILKAVRRTTNTAIVGGFGRHSTRFSPQEILEIKIDLHAGGTGLP